MVGAQQTPQRRQVSTALAVLSLLLLAPVAQAQTPPNDSCLAATVLPPQDVSSPASPAVVFQQGTLVGATSKVWCGSGTANWPGVYYQVTGTGGMLTISTCSPLTTFHTDMSVQEQCNTASCVPIRAKVTSTTCPHLFGNSVSFNSVLGRVYYVLVTIEMAGTPAGTRTFGIAATNQNLPPNTLCSSPLPLTINSNKEVAGTTVAGPVASWCGEPGVIWPSAWFSVVGNGQFMAVSTCSILTTFDAHIAIQPDCSVGTTFGNTCVATSADTQIPIEFVPNCNLANGHIVGWNSVAGQLYWIHVTGGASVPASGSFGVQVTDFPAPGNTQCSSATFLEVNRPTPVAGSTVGAALQPWCGQFNAYGGVWYVVTGRGRRMVATTCHAGTDFDVSVSVQTQCYDPATPAANWECVQTNNPAFVGGCPSNPANGNSASWDSVNGQIYFLFVTGNVVRTFGNFELSVYEVDSASNDQCATATAIAADAVQPTTGSTAGAITTSTFCGGSQGWMGHWYKVTGTGNIMMASTCHAETTFSSALGVYSACGSASCETQIAARVPRFCPTNNNADLYSWQSVAGQEYYIFITGNIRNDGGGYGISVTDFGVPSNGVCKSATSLTVGNPLPVLGHTVGAPAQIWCGQGSAEWEGVWYQVFGTGKVMTATTCAVETNFRTDLSVYTACDAPCLDAEFPDIVCGVNNGVDTSTVTWQSFQNVLYYIFVTSAATGLNGMFGITVTQTDAPLNSECKGATPLTIDDVPTQGTTIGATKNAWCGDSFPGEWPGVWYSLIGTGKRIWVTTCYEETDFDADFSIQTSCEQVSCVNQGKTPCGNRNNGKKYSFKSNAGVPYFIFVTGPFTDVTGNFAIRAQSTNQGNTGVVTPCPDFSFSEACDDKIARNCPCKKRLPCFKEWTKDSTKCGFSSTAKCANKERMQAVKLAKARYMSFCRRRRTQQKKRKNKSRGIY